MENRIRWSAVLGSTTEVIESAADFDDKEENFWWRTSGILKLRAAADTAEDCDEEERDNKKKVRWRSLVAIVEGERD